MHVGRILDKLTKVRNFRAAFS